MNYLLDTNACIALINGKPTSVRARLQKEMTGGSQMFLSSLAAFELWYGVRKSSREEFNTKRLETFLAGPIVLLPFDDEDSKVAGAIRAELERSGKPIGAYGLLIAGQALQRNLTLVTANVAEFSRVKDLVWQDWAKT
jgi:tRNA(fMet)-specific endonuclease VapC